MFKQCIIAAAIVAAIVLASNSLASAQDIFWSLSPTELISTPTSFVNNFNDPETGSAYLFSDGLFGYDALDLDFTTSDPNAIRFTGGEAFNPTLELLGRRRFDSHEITIDADGRSGRLFSIAILEFGVNPEFSPIIDPGFNSEVGPNGAILMARVDFEYVGPSPYGTIDLEVAVGSRGVFQFPDVRLNPTFGFASLTNVLPKIGYCIGDVNRSGDPLNNFTDGVDVFDIGPFIGVLASGDFQNEADCNGDGTVDFLDIAPFINILNNSTVAAQ